MRLFALTAALMIGFIGCSSMKTALGVHQQNTDANKPISNPFGEFYSASQKEPGQNIILRTRKGDRSIEVELPKSSQDISDLTVPIALPGGPNSKGGTNSEGDGGKIDEKYMERKPGFADREIAATITDAQNSQTGMLGDRADRQEIESKLNLVPADNETPMQDKSYLAAIDHVKQLYNLGRFEAALLETDSLVLLYQTDAKIYQMRGTLFDRIGRAELALRSWKQALKLDPRNLSLKKFIERREQNRSVASP